VPTEDATKGTIGPASGRAAFALSGSVGIRSTSPIAQLDQR
jgi:hypothetical protein